MHSTRLLAGALLLATFLEGCGGKGAAVPGAPTAPAQAFGHMTLIVSAASTSLQSVVRRPKFVAPSTTGLAWTATIQGASTAAAQGTADLSSASPLCTGTVPRTCSIPFQLPAETTGTTYTFAVKTFDAAPVGGAIPSSAKQLATSSLVQLIQPNATNSLAFLLNGIIASVNPTTGSGQLSYASLPADGSPHAFGVIVQGLDADGNAISGAIPFASPIAVSLSETGGTGHAKLIINGASSGASGVLTKPTDTLALSYDGGGTPGYSTSTTIGGATVVISPLFLSPSSASVAKLSASVATTITEANAPANIAYAATVGSCPATIAKTLSGSGSSASLSATATTPAGTSATCDVTISDVLGTSVTWPIVLSVSGPITSAAPSFAGGGSGSCGAGIAFTAANQTATIALNDPLVTGTISAVNSSPAVASVSVSGMSATVTALTGGSTTITLSDSAGNTLACPIGVTIVAGSIQ